MKKKEQKLEIPSIAQLEVELNREKYRWRFRRVLRSTIYALITVAAAAVLACSLAVWAVLSRVPIVGKWLV